MNNELNKILIPVYNFSDKEVVLIEGTDGAHKQIIKTCLEEQNVSKKQFLKFFKKDPASCLTLLSATASIVIVEKYNIHEMMSVFITKNKNDFKVYVPVDSGVNNNIEDIQEELSSNNDYISLEETNLLNKLFGKRSNVFLKFHSTADISTFYN